MTAPLLLGDFAGDAMDGLRARIVAEYEIEASALDGLTILAAAGDCGGYEEGHWFLLRRADGMLLENEASHCSCYGFEDQWGPTETSVAALLARKTLTYNMPNGEEPQLRAFIAGLAPS